MRMVKMQQETLTLEEAVQKFLMEKDAQHTGAAAMTDYRNCLARFVKSSHNSIEYDLLDADVLAFFSSIPDTSPARYNKPFQNVNAFLNWMVEQEYKDKKLSSLSSNNKFQLYVEHAIQKALEENRYKPLYLSHTQLLEKLHLVNNNYRINNSFQKYQQHRCNSRKSEHPRCNKQHPGHRQTAPAGA